MRKSLIALRIFLASLCPASAQMMQDIVNARAPVAATYVGPGDIVSGATVDYGLRGYNAAYASPGTNLAVNLRRASDNAACDFVIATSGALGGTAGACAQGGGLSLATFATQDATCTGTISTTTLTCSSASSTPHAGSTLAGVGITQPSYIVSCGTFTGGAGTCTLNATQTVGVGETITMTYGLFVATAYDQSGNGKNATQATAAQQPELLPSCINGLPCLTGVAAGSLAATLSGSVAQPLTMVSVVDILTTSATPLVIGNDSSNVQIGSQNASNVASLWCSSAANATASNNAWHTLAGICNGTSSTLAVDGTGTPLSLGTTAMPTSLFLLNAQSGGTHGWTSYTTEIGLWPSGFNSTQYGNMCHNQFSYWGTSVSC